MFRISAEECEATCSSNANCAGYAHSEANAVEPFPMCTCCTDAGLTNGGQSKGGWTLSAKAACKSTELTPTAEPGPAAEETVETATTVAAVEATVETGTTVAAFEATVETVTTETATTVAAATAEPEPTVEATVETATTMAAVTTIPTTATPSATALPLHTEFTKVGRCCREKKNAVYPKGVAPGKSATRVLLAKTIDQCKRACASNPACHGITFVRSGKKQCWTYPFRVYGVKTCTNTKACYSVTRTNV